jgi:urea transport system substrate-binding protein
MTERPILIVDDDPAILATVAEFLDMEGYPVTTAHNGAEALDRVEQTPPALVLLDMRMPILDGWGFTRELRQRGHTTPIVVMTAAQDTRRWAEEVGAAGYVAKPFDLVDLLSTVEEVYGSTV